MTTCLDIIRRALLAAEGEREVADGADGQLALMRLQDVILSLPRLMDGPWRDVFADEGGAVTAGDGMRVHAGADATVILPLREADGAAIADLSRVQVLGPHAAAGVWIHAASTGAWRRADALSLSSESPFGPEDDAGLSCILALSLAGDGGGTVSPETTARAAAALSSFAARFHRAQDEAADAALLRLSRMGHRGWA